MKRLTLSLLAISLMTMNVFALELVDISERLTDCPINVGCVAWGDVDLDGDEDLFVGGHNGSESELYTSTSGEFTNVTDIYSLSGITDVRSAQFADYDQDGNLDLLLLTEDEQLVRLFRHTSSHRFQQVVINHTMNPAHVVRSANLFDLDHDGALDLILSNGESGNTGLLALRQDPEEFNELRGSSLPSPEMEVGAMNWIDWDQDGDFDLFLGSSDQARFYSNENGVLRDWTPYVCLPSKLGAVTSLWYDFDGDQRVDLFSTGAPEHTHLMRNESYQAGRNLKDYAERYGLGQTLSYGVCANAVDIDMDGTRDLFVVRQSPLGCAMIFNDGNWFDVASRLHVDNADFVNNSSAWGDMDGDGDPDLAIAQEGSGVKLYRNTVQCAHSYIILHICDSNTNAPLANCSVYFQFDDDKAIELTAGSQCATSGSGAAITIVSQSRIASESAYCRITWPNGEQTELQTYNLLLEKHNWIHQPTAAPRVDQLELERGAGYPQVIGNSPNPFNPSTQISFSLTEAGLANLSVFDMLGRKVTELTNQQFDAGEHRVTFDAGDLPSGVYLARLTTARESLVHRMTLVK